MTGHEPAGAGPSRLHAAAARLLDALQAPHRRERTMLAVLAAYVAAWTLYGVIAKASQDIHYDMAELVTQAREPALGYPRHPPLAAMVVKAWFALFPEADWSYYLLAMTNAALALWIVWRLSAGVIDGDKRAVGVLLLGFMPFFTFHALRFNVNAVLLPLWAATTLFFLRAYRDGGLGQATLAGLAAGLAMLGKYWSAVLLLGLGLAALIAPQRHRYLCSTAPAVTIATGALVIAPHVHWLAENGFPSFAFAFEVHGGASHSGALRGIVRYLSGMAAYMAIPIVILLLAARPGLAPIRSLVLPPEHLRLHALAFWLPLLLPVVFALPLKVELVSLWTMPAFSLLPIVLLGAPAVVLSRPAACRLVLLAGAFPLVMLAAAPAVAVATHLLGVPAAAAHGRLLAPAVEALWRETTAAPLRLVGGQADLAYAVAFYSAEQPSAFPDSDPQLAPWISQARIARQGMAFVCETRDAVCILRAERLIAAGPPGLRRELLLTRTFLGIPGDTTRYVIMTLPPR